MGPMKEYSKEWQQIINREHPNLLASLSEREKKRQYIIMEMIDTWEIYTCDLEKILQVPFSSSEFDKSDKRNIIVKEKLKHIGLCRELEGLPSGEGIS